MKVIGLSRTKSDLEETARLCKPNSFAARVVDVADSAAVLRMFADISASGSYISVLINNAALYHRCDFARSEPHDTMESININLGGIINCTLAALKGMTVTGIGRIINVASFADLGPIPGSLPYSVSKGAARIFTRALVAEIGDRLPNIVVNDWIPGSLATRMGEPDGIDPSVSATWGVNLALIHDHTLNGATFYQETEILAPRGRKRQLLDIALLKRPPKPRRL